MFPHGHTSAAQDSKTGSDARCDGPRNEEGVVALATLAPSFAIGFEWPSVLSAAVSEDLDQVTSRMTSK